VSLGDYLARIVEQSITDALATVVKDGARKVREVATVAEKRAELYRELRAQAEATQPEER
jgi:hypothetical protein